MLQFSPLIVTYLFKVSYKILALHQENILYLIIVFLLFILSFAEYIINEAFGIEFTFKNVDVS